MKVDIPLVEMISDLENVPGITAIEKAIGHVACVNETVAQLVVKLETDQSRWLDEEWVIEDQYTTKPEVD